MANEISWIERVASSQWVWAILFILSLVVVGRFILRHIKQLQDEALRREKSLIELYEKQREESLQRENRLLDHLDKTSALLEGINRNLASLEQRLERGLGEIWDRLNKK